MARSLAQYVFTALLALLSAHAAVPSGHPGSPAKAVWRAETEQRDAERIWPLRVETREPLAAVEYSSRAGAPPDTAILFQRPPPATPLVA